MSISQKLGITLLIPKKNKSLEHLELETHLITTTDYKISTKTIAVRLEKVLPSHHSSIPNRLCIRLISDTMSLTKQRIIPGAAVFLDFEKAFDLIEWNFLQKCLKVFNSGLQFRCWVNIFYDDISSCILNNGFASELVSIGSL